MYCSINEAWDNKNSMKKLTEKYKNNFNKDINNNFSFLKVDSETENKTDTDDFRTEDIMIDTPEINIPEKKKILKKDNLDCEELVEKVLNCTKCKRLIMEKLNIDKSVNSINPLNNLMNNELKEIMILILIGLIVMIFIDLFIRISK